MPGVLPARPPSICSFGQPPQSGPSPFIQLLSIQNAPVPAAATPRNSRSFLKNHFFFFSVSSCLSSVAPKSLRIHFQRDFTTYPPATRMPIHLAAVRAFSVGWFFHSLATKSLFTSLPVGMMCWYRFFFSVVLVCCRA